VFNRITFRGQVSFQIGYKGLIDLVTRSGQVISIVAQEVCQGDQFHFEYGRNEQLTHVPAPFQKRGEPIAYYAYAHLKNGGFVFQVMSVDEIKKIRDDHSISYKFDKNNSIWAKHWESMALKTVIKRLIKYLPISVESQAAVSYDETIKKDITAEAFTIEADEIEIIDAKEVEANG
jgi:recombination protein RecT